MNDHQDHTTRAGRIRSRRRRRAALWPAALLAIVVLAAGCGGNSPGPGVARNGSSSSTTTGSSAGSRADQSGLAYAACIRSHGVRDFPDPGPKGGFNITNDPNNPQMQAAQRACANLLPGGGQMTTGASFTPGQVAQLLQYARCMRSHGIVNFPDPTSKGMGALNGIDPNSPQFNAASQACQSLLPNLGGDGPVSGPGGGS